MAYDRSHLEVSWIFRIDGTDEVAMTGLSVTGAPGFDAVAALLQYDEVVDGQALGQAMTTFLSANPIAWADYSFLTDVKVAAVDVTGHYINTAGNPKIWSADTTFHGTDTQIVPQCSIVLSLRSPTTLGRANYGRMYLPHTLLPLGAGNPSALATTAEEAATKAATFINEVNEIFDTGDDPGVVQIMSSVAPGLSKAVTRVAVGDVNDTQRRRRNRLPENYSFEAVAGT